MGSRRIKSMIASTNDAYCPTLRAVTDVGAARRRELGARDRDQRHRRRRRSPRAMRAGIDAACRDGVVSISRRQLRRQARPAPLPPAQDHGRGRRHERPRRPAPDRARAAAPTSRAVLAGAWTALAPAELARRAGRRSGAGRACRSATCSTVTGDARRHASASPATSAGPTASAPASPKARVVVEGDVGRRGRARRWPAASIEVRGDAGDAGRRARRPRPRAG